MFTFSFSTAMAATNADDFATAIQKYKGTLSYDGNGYLNKEVEPAKGWSGIISKAVLEAAIDTWAGNVDLSSADNYVTGTGSSAEIADKEKMLNAIEADVETAQYDVELAKLNELIASIDLAAYNKTGKTALQNAIETAENTVANLSAKDVADITAVKNAASTLKGVVDANKGNLLTETAKDLATQVADLRKTLDDASYEYYAYARDILDVYTATDANKLALKASFEKDYNAIVDFWAASIDRFEEESKAGEKPFDTYADIKSVITFYFTITDNSPLDAAKKFQYFNQAMKQKDIWVAYYEKAAADAKAELRADGTKKYYDADVDKLLADTKDAVAVDMYAQIDTYGSESWGNTAAVKWAELSSLANTLYNLQAYRMKATEKFTTGDYALGNWFGARKGKVEDLQEAYAEKVLLAKSVEEIDALVKEAKDAIDKIMTTTDVDTVSNRVENRVKAAGYLETLTVSNKGKVETAEGNGFAAYFDVVVGSSKTYKDAIKVDALKAAAQVFVDAVLAEENDSITYKQIDEIIAANKDAAYAALKDVKTTEELKAEAAEVANLIKALPEIITIADKEQVMAAQAAMDAYVENAGAKQTDVAKYTKLKSALTTIIEAEAREVSKLIRALPLKASVTLADAEKIVAAREAYEALDKAYGDYIGSAFSNVASLPNDSRLDDAEEALEKAKLENAAKLIEALTSASTKAEIEAAKAAFDDLKTISKLTLNDQLYNKLMNAVASLSAKDIKAVKSMKLRAYSKYAKKGITVKWVIEDGRKSDAAGYQVWRSTKANNGYKKLITVKGYGVNNAKNLKKGTTYYYKVRAYKRVEGKLYFSDWSNKAYRKAK